MKFIFLDIDGVLNSKSCRVKTPSGYDFVEDKLIARLAKIVEATDAKIILSSTWRKGWYDIQDGSPDTTDALDYIELSAKLLEYGISIFGHTPLSYDSCRGREIEAFLLTQDEKIESFIILDDCDNMKPYRNRLIRTNPSTGITQNNVTKAIMMLEEDISA